MEKLIRIRLISNEALINFGENVFTEIYYDKTDDMPFDMLKRIIQSVTPFEVQMLPKKVSNPKKLVVVYSLEGLINRLRHIKEIKGTVLASEKVTDTVGFQIYLPEVKVKAFWKNGSFSFFKLECTHQCLDINYDKLLSKLNAASVNFDAGFSLGKNNTIYTYCLPITDVYSKDSSLFINWESYRVVYKEEEHKFTY